MENTPTPNSDFENYLRRNLQQVDETPDDDVWAGIAAKQAQPNRRLKLRRYGVYAAAAVLLIILLSGLWLHRNDFSRNADNSVPQEEQPHPAAQEQLPMAGNDLLPEVDKQQKKTPANSKHASIPHFGPRLNSVPAATIRFQAEKGLCYLSPLTGNQVSIPANSLVDQSGQAVTGEAELFFREYRTIEEFLASGIPMHYADGRGDFAFNSGGMFEVRVSQGEEMLKMGAGKNYDLTFSPTQELDKASLYYLDDQTKSWEFRPENALGQANLTEPPVTSESSLLRQQMTKADCRPDPGQLADEPEPAELVMEGVKIGFELATGKLVMPTWFRKNPYLTDDQLLFRLEKGLIQVKKHRDQAQLFFPEDLNKFFTELGAFKDCYFTYNVDSLSGTKKGKYLTSSDYWQRITVAHEGGANCVITLYDGKEGQMQFHAVLTGSTENKNFKAEKVFADYEARRHKRQLDFALRNRALRYFLYASSAFKPKEEYCLSVFHWLEHFESNHPMMARRYAALVKEGLTTDPVLAAEAWKNWQRVLREQRFARMPGGSALGQAKNDLQYSLHLSDFGVYNYDQIFRLRGEGTQFVHAAYKTPDGKAIAPAFVSIMERRTKLFFTLPNAAKLLYSPDRKLDIVVTDRDGRQYHLSREQYAGQKFNVDGLTVLTLNDVTEQTQSPKAWADLLEI